MKRRSMDEPLNGISIDEITISQDGEFEVNFVIPEKQTTDNWYVSKNASRSFDLDEEEHKDLMLACREVFKIAREKMKQPDEDVAAINCDKCKKSYCCREYSVLIDERDIERLANHLNMTESVFIDKYTEEGIDWTGDYKHQLVKDKDEEGDEKCVFLKQDENKLWRCSVYEHRPDICDNYEMKSCDIFVSIDDIEVAS